MDKQLCYETIPSKNIRSVTYKIAPMWLYKHELDTYNKNSHANLDGRKYMNLQHYTEYYRKLSNSKNSRNHISRNSILIGYPNHKCVGQQWKFRHRLERQQSGVYGRVLWEKKGNDVIIYII